jgi:flagellar export protein FliJ
MADATARLLRLRAAEADAARRDMAAAMAAQDATMAREAQARAAVTREMRGAPRDAADPLIGAYAAWLPAGQAAIGRARNEAAAAVRAVDAARAALASARMAYRACESLADAQAEARRLDALKREQVTLDDAARNGAG